MVTCGICNHIELSNQEMIVYRLVDNFKTSTQISKATGYSRKVVLQVLYKLEKCNFIKRIGKKNKAIIFKALKFCTSCDKFQFMSAFNIWSCNKSKGIYWYCNDYKI